MGGPMMRVGIRGGARHRKGDGLTLLREHNPLEMGRVRKVEARPFMRTE